MNAVVVFRGIFFYACDEIYNHEDPGALTSNLRGKKLKSRIWTDRAKIGGSH